LAATNRPDVLDPALLRPGRFDRRVVLDLPDVVGRSAILKVHTKNKPLATSVNLETLAKETAGFSGADLANLVNEAAILAARQGQKTIEMKDLEESIDKVIAVVIYINEKMVWPELAHLATEKNCGLLLLSSYS
jgi:cell division protease FtsH